MKKTLLLLASLAFAAVASADAVKYLTFRTANGTEQSLPVAGGVDITFNDGEIVATAPGTVFRASLTDIRDMWFSYEASSIEAVLTDCASSGNRVEIFTSDGRSVADFVWGDSTAPVLPSGFYLVRTGGRTQKVFIKGGSIN